MPSAVINDLYETDKDVIDKLVNNSSNDAFAVATVITKPDKRRGILLWFEDIKAYRPHILAHEAAHAVFDIFTEVGIPVSYDNQEAFCYCLDFIIKKLTEAKHLSRTY